MPAETTPVGRSESVHRGEVYVISSQVEKWRFKCANPPHHDDWRLWNGIFCCETCKRLRDNGETHLEATFAELWDSKEEQLVPREQIRVERPRYGGMPDAW